MPNVSNAELLRVSQAILKRVKDLEKAFLAFKRELHPSEDSDVVDLADDANAEASSSEEEANDANAAEEDANADADADGTATTGKRSALGKRRATTTEKKPFHKLISSLPQLDKDAPLKTLLVGSEDIASSLEEMEDAGAHWKTRDKVKRLFADFMEATTTTLHDHCNKDRTHSEAATFQSVLKWMHLGGKEMRSSKALQIHAWGKRFSELNLKRANQDEDDRDTEPMSDDAEDADDVEESNIAEANIEEEANAEANIEEEANEADTNAEANTQDTIAEEANEEEAIAEANTQDTIAEDNAE